MGHYHKYIGQTLKSKIDSFLNAPQGEQLALYEELAVARTTALESLQLFDIAMGSGDDKTRAMAIGLVRQSMDHVREMCLAASRIEKDAEDKVSSRSISLFIAQIVRAIYRVCPDKTLAQRIESEIDKSVRLPRELQPSTQTPAETALEMDRMVPLNGDR